MLQAHASGGSAAAAKVTVDVPGRVEEPAEGAPPLRLPAVDVLGAVAAARLRLIEALADLDEAVAEAYLGALEGAGGAAGAARAAALAGAMGIDPGQASLGLDASPTAAPGLDAASLR